MANLNCRWEVYLAEKTKPVAGYDKTKSEYWARRGSQGSIVLPDEEIKDILEGKPQS